MPKDSCTFTQTASKLNCPSSILMNLDSSSHSSINHHLRPSPSPSSSFSLSRCPSFPLRFPPQKARDGNNPKMFQKYFGYNVMERYYKVTKTMVSSSWPSQSFGLKSPDRRDTWTRSGDESFKVISASLNCLTTSFVYHMHYNKIYKKKHSNPWYESTNLTVFI